MINLIRKIAPERTHKASKIGSVIAFNETLVSFVIDSVYLEVLEFNRKDKKVIHFIHFNLRKKITTHLF